MLPRLARDALVVVAALRVPRHAPPGRRRHQRAEPAARPRAPALAGAELGGGRFSLAAAARPRGGRQLLGVVVRAVRARGARAARPSPGTSATRRDTVVGVVFNDTLSRGERLRAPLRVALPLGRRPGRGDRQPLRRHLAARRPSSSIDTGGWRRSLLGPVSASRAGARRGEGHVVRVLALLPALVSRPSSAVVALVARDRPDAPRPRSARSPTSSPSCAARPARTSRSPRATRPRPSRCATRSPARVAAGDSDSQILTSLEATYGTSVLLSPPTSGLGALLWAVPVAAARTGRCVACAWRGDDESRRAPAGATRSRCARPPSPTPRRELDAGELSHEEFDDDRAQRETTPSSGRAATSRRFDVLPAPTETTRRPRVRRGPLAGARDRLLRRGARLRALGATDATPGWQLRDRLAVARQAPADRAAAQRGRGRRRRRQSSRGTEPPTARCSRSTRPNVAALTESGWLDFSAGSASHDTAVVEVGIKNLEKAVALAPRQAAPRLYSRSSRPRRRATRPWPSGSSGSS